MAQSTTGILSLNVDEIIFNDNTILNTAIDINNNTTAIATNTTALALANTNITNNTTAIATNTTALALANTNITNNTTALALANTNITNNTNNIVTNSTAISTLNTELTAYNFDICLNTTAISNLNTELTASNVDIGLNTTAISTLNTELTASNVDIGLNTTAISTLNTELTTTTSTANTTNTRLNTLFTTNAEQRFEFVRTGFWGRIKMTSGHSTLTRLYIQPDNSSKPLTLLVDGDIECDTITETSDDRIKNNEKLIENATETIMKLTPQIYDKYDNMDLSGNYKKNSGLITQEVYYNAPELRHLITLGLEDDKEIIPDEMDLSSVEIGQDPDYSSHGWSKTEKSSLNYNGLIAYLIKSNQELNKRLLDLEAQI